MAQVCQFHISGSSTLYHDYEPFRLHNVLHYPSISINLLSVNQFTRANDCCFVFFSNGFCIKDTKTGKMLFQGKSENWVYPVRHHRRFQSNASSPIAFVGERVIPPYGINGWDTPHFPF